MIGISFGSLTSVKKDIDERLSIVTSNVLPGRSYFFPKPGSYLSNETDYWYMIDQVNRGILYYFDMYKLKYPDISVPYAREGWVLSLIYPDELAAFKIWKSSQNTGNWYDNIIQQGFFPQITSQVDAFIDEQPLAQILAPQAVITNESLKHPVESAIIVGSAAIASSAIAAGSGAATSEGALLGQTGLLSDTGAAATFAEPVALSAPVLTTGATLGETAGWTAFINEANDFLGETNQFLRSPIGEILADNLNGGKNNSFVPDPNYSASKDNDIFFIIILMTTSFLFLIF